MKPTVLVVDDKANMLALLGKVLGKSARVVTARGVKTALQILERDRVTVVLCDLRMPDGDGLEVLRAIRMRWPSVPFILMTAFASVSTAVQAMREGAYDYVTKPFDPDEIKAIVARAVSRATVLADEETETQVSGCGPLIGASLPMKAVYQAIERVAPTDATTLIVGEPGTGKELVARAVHERSGRSGARLITLACDAIPQALIESELFGYVRGAFTGANVDRPGLFEEANGGALLIDDIGVLRPNVQAKIARALEERVVRRIGESRERRIDVRLLATTQQDLRSMVKAGSFREDLWFRLNVCVIDLPPLRDRPGDVRLLAHRFLAERAPLTRSPATRIGAEAMSALESYHWPGNVRELRSAIERAAIVEDTSEIQLGSLPDEVRGSTPLRLSSASELDLASLSYRDAVDASREETNRRYLEAILRRTSGDVSAAASHAGVERESFYRLMRRYGLTADQFRDARARDGQAKN